MRLYLTVLASAAALAVPAFAQQAAPAGAPAPQSSPIYTEPQSSPVYPGPKDFFEQELDAKPVYAVIGGHVVSGEIQPGRRLEALRDTRQPDFACSLSQRGAKVRLDCTGGAIAEVAIKSNGCGASRAGETASICVGWAARAAVRRLTAPVGHMLALVDGRPTLKPSA